MGYNVKDVSVAPVCKVQDFKIESGVKMEAVGPSETTVPVYYTTRRHIPEGRSVDM
jgi:hypothetical protein